MKRRALLAMAGLAALFPQAADAHLVTTGMGPLYDGITHFALSPEDFLPVIALAFYAGLRGPASARAGLAAVVTGWIAGGALALAGVAPQGSALPAATAILFLGIGGALAADLALQPVLVAALGLALGLVRGDADLAGVALTLPHGGTLAGMSAAVFALFALAASLTLPLERLWAIVAARVGGSWLAALGLLFAGWILRYGAAIR